MLDGADTEQSLCIMAFCMAGFHAIYVGYEKKVYYTLADFKSG